MKIRNLILGTLSVITITCVVYGSIKHLKVFTKPIFDTPIISDTTSNSKNDVYSNNNTTDELNNINNSENNDEKKLSLRDCFNELKDAYKEYKHEYGGDFNDLRNTSVSGSINNITEGLKIRKISESIKTTTISDELNISDLQNIVVNSNNAFIHIQSGDKYFAECIYPENVELEYSLENKSLLIDLKIPTNTIMFGDNTCTINITIPSKDQLDDVTFNTNNGNIKLEGIYANTFNIDTNNSDIIIDNCTLNKINSKSNNGDLLINNSIFKKIDSDTNNGDVKISSKEKLDDFSFDISTNKGDINIFSNVYEKKYKQIKNLDKTINAHSNNGNIKI